MLTDTLVHLPYIVNPAGNWSVLIKASPPDSYPEPPRLIYFALSSAVRTSKSQSVTTVIATIIPLLGVNVVQSVSRKTLPICPIVAF